MTESHHAPTQNPFTPAEWDALRTADLAAGRAVIILMVSIFCIGIVLYSIVAAVCAGPAV